MKKEEKITLWDNLCHDRPAGIDTADILSSCGQPNTIESKTSKPQTAKEKSGKKNRMVCVVFHFM